MYFCIDMKCYFASVECALRGLNPLTTPLVVADESKGKGTLCLAISPYLKRMGVKNRCRLYEIPKDIPYIIAKPRMKKYIQIAVSIHQIFLRYISADDIHTYSIDEAFLHVSSYMLLYNNPITLATMILKDIKNELGIVAACGAGDNLFLAKVCLDLKAKNEKNNFYYLSLEEFYNTIWFHPKLTDIWQIGKGISKRLNKLGLYTLKDIALCDKNILIQEFGVIGEDLYEYAWGKDLTTIDDIKAYQPKSKSYSRNQILFRDYSKEEAWTPLLEMLFLLCIDLYKNEMVTNTVSFYIGFSNHAKSFHKVISLFCFTSDYFFIKKVLEENYKEVPLGAIRQIGISISHLASSLEMNSLFDHQDDKYLNLYHSIHSIWQKYGKNQLVLGTALKQESTLYERNKTIGGHNSD
ncbi:MAG: hypothetical protein K2I42_06795 [Anaeroplasmataceae bacterium]|nr:hypothetical protein [Anaeroplasmataceae bacterium]